MQKQVTKNKNQKVINWIRRKKKKKIRTEIDKHLSKGGQFATLGRRRHLRRVDRRNHERESHADASDEPSTHEEPVVGGEPHEQSSNKEDDCSEDDGVAPPYPIGRPPRQGGAEKREDIDRPHQDLDLHIGNLQIPLYEERRSTHHSCICAHTKHTLIYIYTHIYTYIFDFKKIKIKINLPYPSKTAVIEARTEIAKA